MKKNRMMRLASGLLVAVLITTSTISGTYAKYVTEDSATDSARVAKFGVVVTADGSLFAETYIDAPDTSDSITVQSIGDFAGTSTAENPDNVVAPGTTNAAEAFTFSITGQPEVDVKVDVVVTEADKDVFLKAGTYEKLTTGDDTDEYVLAEDYYPVKYSLKKQGEYVIYNKTLAELKAALEDISVDKVDANQDLAKLFGEYEITWAWEFNGNDDADTILGDLAAGSPEAGLDGATLTKGTDYNLGTGLKVEVTVTQLN